MTDPLGLIGQNASIKPVHGAGHGGGANAANSANGADFRQALEKSLAEVNALQEDAKTAVEDYASGDRTDLEGVITATKQAETAFKMFMQVRNKVMDAIEEVKQVSV